MAKRKKAKRKVRRKKFKKKVRRKVKRRPRRKGEAIDHPSHYRADTGHEAIDVIEAWDLGFNLGSAVKYIARDGHKQSDGAIEGLEKAEWYIRREIARRKAQA